MMQHELWLKKYQEGKSFIEPHHRNPSRHNPEERFQYCNWLKHNKKLLNRRMSERKDQAGLGSPEREGGNAKRNAGEMKEDRVTLFENLLEMGERYRRKNQYE